MKNVYDLEGWKLDKTIPNSKRFVDVSIHIQYPDYEKFIDCKPKERRKKIDQELKESLNKLISLSLFDQFKVTGTKKSPRVLKTKVKFSALRKLSKLDYISLISVGSVDHAIKIEVHQAPVDKYFCVKMTAVIEIEGVSSKRQSIEQRFVIIRAKTSDEAYEKLEAQRDDYTHTYLNSDGRLVRWRIDSFDNCYETDIKKPKDIDDPEGIEVYSKLKSRKVKTPVVWDGKP